MTMCDSRTCATPRDALIRRVAGDRPADDRLAAAVVPSRRFRSSYARRTETQSIESDAEPTAVVALLADPTRIPDWAPAFADAVTRDDQSGWLATKSDQGFTVRVVT